MEAVGDFSRYFHAVNKTEDINLDDLTLRYSFRVPHCRCLHAACTVNARQFTTSAWLRSGCDWL